MKYAELERKLKAAGCYEVSKNGKSNHPKWYSPITGKVFSLSHHRSEEVRGGTLRSILRDSGVDL